MCCLRLGWLYPPSIYLLYALLRAAGVTEKASRVGPLVNSWKFQAGTVPWVACLWLVISGRG